MRRVTRRAASLAEISPGIGYTVSLGPSGPECTLFLCDGKVHAVGSLCPHQNTPLDGASAAGGVVTCRRHGFQFDLRSGDCLTLGGYGLPVYATEVVDGEVFVSFIEYSIDSPPAC